MGWDRKTLQTLQTLHGRTDMSKQRIKMIQRRYQRGRPVGNLGFKFIEVVAPGGDLHDVIFMGPDIPETEPGTMHRAAVKSSRQWRPDGAAMMHNVASENLF